MPDTTWDFQVERIGLYNLNIDAGNKLGMVLVQPDYELEPESTVPFCISSEFRDAQNTLINKAFLIRLAESQERNMPTPFILFPEAAIPVGDPDGLDCLREQLEETDDDIIFIGGLEGMSPQQARELSERFRPALDIAKPAFAEGTFVNICVIAVKSHNGPITWHFQAKLAPSPWEQPRGMARGQRLLYFFTPTGVAFLCQICFDHIAAQGQESLNTVLFRKLIDKNRPLATPLDFVFVPQWNPKPKGPSFTQSTKEILSHQDRLLNTDLTTVIVANRAATVQEPSEYGQSGIYYRSGRWLVSPRDLGPKGYELYDNKSYNVTSAIFRKRTQAIHVATLVPPAFNIGESGNPRQPLENVRSYFIKDGCNSTPCSCLPGTERSIGKFVECDCLPCKLRDCLLEELPSTDPRNRWIASDESQSHLLTSYYKEIRHRLLSLSCKRAADLLDVLFLMRENRKGNPDLWNSLEKDAVCELSAASSALRVIGRLEFHTEAQWTAILESETAIVALDGEHKSNCRTLGARYLEQCERNRPEARFRPILIIALRSTGRVDPIVQRFQPEYDEPRTRGPFAETNHCEPSQARTFLCKDDLFQEARCAPSIRDYLTQAMREISA